MNKAGVRFLSYDLIAQKAEEVLTSFNPKERFRSPSKKLPSLALEWISFLFPIFSVILKSMATLPVI
jgi:hypothetical protein